MPATKVFVCLQRSFEIYSLILQKLVSLEAGLEHRSPIPHPHSTPTPPLPPLYPPALQLQCGARIERRWVFPWQPQVIALPDDFLELFILF